MNVLNFDQTRENHFLQQINEQSKPLDEVRFMLSLSVDIKE